MTTQTGNGDKKAASPKRRKRDNNAKYKPSKIAAEVFVENLATNTGKGAITRAAQAAYPNQNANSAHATGSKLLQNPTIVANVTRRRLEAAKSAGVTRDMLVGLLMQIATASLADFKNAEGNLDWELAKERGIDHLIHAEDITERHSAIGSYRVTRKFKLPDKVRAMDLIAEITGMKKQPGKNPLDSARDNFLIMRAKAEYADLSDEELAKYPAQNHKVTVAEILEGKVGG